MYRPTYINIHQTCSATSTPWNVSELLQPGLGPHQHNPSLLPLAPEGGGSGWAAAAPSPAALRSVQFCPGDDGSRTARGALCCCQRWSHPHSLQKKTCKVVNKSTSWGHCYLVLQAGLLFFWAPGEARGSQESENRLCSTAGWALPHCHCSSHNSPEVRGATRRERGAQQAEGKHSHTTWSTAALWQRNKAALWGSAPSRHICECIADWLRSWEEDGLYRLQPPRETAQCQRIQSASLRTHQVTESS